MLLKHCVSGWCSWRGLAAHARRYVDSRAENGLTALHMAAAIGDLDCVQQLLNAGASMMVRH